MTPVEQLRTILAALSLTAIDARLEGLLEGAANKEPSYADFLLEVMNTRKTDRWQAPPSLNSRKLATAQANRQVQSRVNRIVPVVQAHGPPIGIGPVVSLYDNGLPL
jgi:hypothetical protein